MDDLEIQILIDSIADELSKHGKNPDQIEDYLIQEANRVSQEIRDKDNV